MGLRFTRRSNGAAMPNLAAMSPGRLVLCGIAIAWGFSYPFSYIDIIPNRLPVLGYLDQILFAALALILSAWLIAGRQGDAPASLDDSAELPVWAPGRDVRPARLALPASWRDARIAWAQKMRQALLDGFAHAFASPLLRLAMGRWPTAPEVAAFRHAFRRFAPVPPLMRALASVPAARHQVMRTMLISWMLADETYRGRLRAELGSADEAGGDHLAVWLGPKVTFLHLEKTAGMAVLDVLTARFHPMQIDPDPRRTYPPHILTPLPPSLIDPVKRYALVWGHYDLPSIRRLGNDRFVFTMLREPRARVLSLYRYWRSVAAQDVGWAGANAPVLAAQRLSLLDFLQSDDPAITDYIDNFYVRRLTGAYASCHAADPLRTDPVHHLGRALDGLASLDFVGLTEDTDAAVQALAARLGFPTPAATPRVNVTRGDGNAAETRLPAVQAALDRLTGLDSMVYEAARRRRSMGVAP
jgi:hypothetical protein